jgi:hypothetical protein
MASQDGQKKAPREAGRLPSFSIGELGAPICASAVCAVMGVKKSGLIYQAHQG